MRLSYAVYTEQPAAKRNLEAMHSRQFDFLARQSEAVRLDIG